MIKEITDRRSIRKYADKDVSLELVNQMIAAARLAPSGKNRQPWKFIVFMKEQKNNILNVMEQGLMREKEKHDFMPGSSMGVADAFYTLKIMRNAPCVIFIYNTNSTSDLTPITDTDSRFREQCDLLSIGAAIQNMILTGTELGLGTLWIGNTCFAYPELTNALAEPYQLIGAVAVGYPSENPAARPRKDMEELVEYKL